VFLYHFDSTALHLTGHEQASKVVELFVYHSCTPLTTLGYGDIVPESSQGRTSSVTLPGNGDGQTVIVQWERREEPLRRIQAMML